MKSPMSVPMLNVLFLCSENAARSLMAEALLRHLGQGRFVAYSAGRVPAAEADPAALALLRREGCPVADLHPKSWTEFAGCDAPQMHLVVCVCNATAGEPCPDWPGDPLRAHWHIDEPMETGDDPVAHLQATETMYRDLHRRVAGLVQMADVARNGPAIRGVLAQIANARVGAPG